MGQCFVTFKSLDFRQSRSIHLSHVVLTRLPTDLAGPFYYSQSYSYSYTLAIFILSYKNGNHDLLTIVTMTIVTMIQCLSRNVEVWCNLPMYRWAPGPFRHHLFWCLFSLRAENGATQNGTVPVAQGSGNRNGIAAPKLGKKGYKIWDFLMMIDPMGWHGTTHGAMNDDWRSDQLTGSWSPAVDLA